MLSVWLVVKNKSQTGAVFRASIGIGSALLRKWWRSMVCFFIFSPSLIEKLKEWLVHNIVWMDIKCMVFSCIADRPSAEWQRFLLFFCRYFFQTCAAQSVVVYSVVNTVMQWWKVDNPIATITCIVNRIQKRNRTKEYVKDEKKNPIHFFFGVLPPNIVSWCFCLFVSRVLCFVLFMNTDYFLNCLF